jgi:hypothetical protein
MFLSPEAAPQDTHSGLFKLLLLKKKKNNMGFHCFIE